MVLVIRRLQELARKKRIPLYVCFIDLIKAYDSIDRTLLWTVLARSGVSQNLVSVIRQFYDGMRACVRLDDRVCSRWLAVSRVRARASPVQHILHGGYKRGLHAPRRTKASWTLCFGTSEEEKGGREAEGGNCRRVGPVDAALGHAIC